MDELLLYGRLGFKHIIDLGGVDHILFVLALTLRYVWSDWKKILVLVTSFTIGHSLTLALSTLSLIDISVYWIEFLIPVTILITALSNFWVKDFEFTQRYSAHYGLALFFGLIHGLGFSNYLKSLLGKESSLLGPLFSFNIGLEIGQILIVGVILAISYCLVTILKIPRKMYVRYGSILAISLSLRMILERLGSL
ncbi:MAG: HupE/UreJ family protein [Sediminibacterium sp.]